MSARKLISIVTPCYNEETNVDQHFAAVLEQIAPFRDRYDFEHIYTDNCSLDSTFQRLRFIAEKNPNVRLLRFSRNIGSVRAIYQGLIHAKGDAAILIQADLQDPPSLVPTFIREWENGFDVVYGQIQSREEGLVMRNLRKLYYTIVARLADVTPARNAGEFRLTSRRVLNAISQYHEDELYLRGILAHIGFRQKAIPYNRAPRLRGASSNSILDLISFAINALSATSVVPIRMVTFIGLFAAGFGAIYASFILFMKFFFPAQVPSGVTTLASLIIFFAGAQLLSLGIIGEYIRKIYLQSLQRPQAFFQDRVNFDRPGD
jgi:dolichol-phosphate mannosyltransferase